MIRQSIRVALASCALGFCVSTATAQDSRNCRTSEPVNTLELMWKALGDCWRPPIGSEGLEVTVRFSIKRDGSLNGKPQITWLKRAGSEAQRQAFVASVFEALETALPVPLTDAMGRVAAGRPMTMRFSSPNPKEKTL